MKDALGSPQTLLLLGAGSDIGQATARALAGRRTTTVALAGRSPEGYESFANELRGLGVTRVETMAFDADDTGSHKAFLDDVVSRVGDIDVALLAWGVLGEQEKAEEDPEAAAAILQTNFVGAASIGVALAQRLRTQGHGTIVALSSVAGERARRSNFVYGSSKAGLDAFFQGLGDSLVGSGASVLIVRPGFVHSKMTAGMKAAPLSTTPEKVAEVIVHGLASGAEQAWAPAPLRFVMTVLRHLPRRIFRRLPI